MVIAFSSTLLTFWVSVVSSSVPYNIFFHSFKDVYTVQHFCAAEGWKRSEFIWLQEDGRRKKNADFDRGDEKKVIPLTVSQHSWYLLLPLAVVQRSLKSSCSGCALHDVTSCAGGSTRWEKAWLVSQAFFCPLCEKLRFSRNSGWN